MNDAGAWQVERWQQAGWRTRRWIVFSAMLTMGLMLGQPVRAQTISDTLRYDERGNLNRLTLEGLVIDHRYDGIDRLRAETGAGNQQFDLDADGNRLADRTSRYRVAPGAQRLADRDGVALVHGPAGHLLSDRVRMGGQWLPREFTWNLAGQLDTVRINGVVVASYRYNAAGQRTRKTLTNPPPGVPAVTLYRHDPEGQLVMEVAGSPAQTPGLAVSVGQVLVRYIWHDATPVAIIWPPRTPGNPNGTSDRIVYLHTDHLNTPRRATDARGVMVWMWTSDAYGASLPHEDVAGDGFRTVINLRFPGQYYDAESGLHYNWHRYYDPQVGRYTQSDPIGLVGGTNTYAYVGGNPISQADPLGLGDCIYSITSGKLDCNSDLPNHEGFNGLFASGNNSVPGCKNNPACISKTGVGPIPTGYWYWDPNGKSGKPGGRVLVPIKVDASRNNIRSHSCQNPFGPSKVGPFCSEGCLTGTTSTIDALNTFLASEWAGGARNKLSVLP